MTTEETAVQETYLAPDVPPGYVIPPAGTMFANATWLRAGPDIEALVEELLGFDEFSDLRDLNYVVTWRRQTKPMRGDEPVFVSADIVAPRMVWEALQLEVPDFPRYLLDLHWSHFDDLRRGRTPGEPERQGDEQVGGSGASYVHRTTLQQHIHHALMGLSVDNDIVKRRQPDYAGFAATIKRFGQWNLGVVALARQLALWPNRED